MGFEFRYIVFYFFEPQWEGKSANNGWWVIANDIGQQLVAHTANISGVRNTAKICGAFVGHRITVVAAKWQ